MKGSSPDFRGQRREDFLQARVRLVRKGEGARWLERTGMGREASRRAVGKLRTSSLSVDASDLVGEELQTKPGV